MDYTYNLDLSGRQFNCDKSSLHHDYCRIYSAYLPAVPGHGFRMLEIGYGGYEDPKAGGESARMWKHWAPQIDLTVVDLYPKENIPEGVHFIHGSQTSPNTYLGQSTWQVIIDDGSHRNGDVIKTFELLWSFLVSGGLYFIEDTHSSYDPYYADSCSEPVPKSSISTGTAMEYFTQLTHQVNKSFFNEQYHKPYDIEFIHFYKDLIIIRKHDGPD